MTYDWYGDPRCISLPNEVSLRNFQTKSTGLVTHLVLCMRLFVINLSSAFSGTSTSALEALSLGRILNAGRRRSLDLEPEACQRYHSHLLCPSLSSLQTIGIRSRMVLSASR